jgi:hypothetical protein
VQVIEPGGQHDQRRGRVDGACEAVAGADRVDQVERFAV